MEWFDENHYKSIVRVLHYDDRRIGIKEVFENGTSNYYIFPNHPNSYPNRDTNPVQLSDVKKQRRYIIHVTNLVVVSKLDRDRHRIFLQRLDNFF